MPELQAGSHPGTTGYFREQKICCGCNGQRHREDYQQRSEEHTSELQSPCNLVCRLLLEKKKTFNSGSVRQNTATIISRIARRRGRDMNIRLIPAAVFTPIPAAITRIIFLCLLQGLGTL